MNRRVKRISWCLIGICLLVTVLPLSGCLTAEPKYGSQSSAVFSFTDIEQLRSFMRWRPGRGLFIRAHRGAARGAPQPGFPENCIATFEYAMSCVPCFFEIDVRRTSDGLYVIHHDETLERCTTGQGELADYTLEQLKTLFLKDPTGAVTSHRMPTFAEVLDWARGRTILFVDVKKPLSRAEVCAFIREHNAESFCIPMTYQIEDTLECHRVAPQMLILGRGSDYESARALLNNGIPADRLIAYVRDETPVEIYELLHKHGIMVIRALNRMDRKAAEEGLAVYYPALEKGPDIIETENVPNLLAALRAFESDCGR